MVCFCRCVCGMYILSCGVKRRGSKRCCRSHGGTSGLMREKSYGELDDISCVLSVV